MQLIANNPVEKAILDRHSVRAFTQQDVSDDCIRDIVNKAARAPSGTNTQPWKVYAVKGESKRQITEQVIDAINSVQQDPVLKSKFVAPYLYYPGKWFDPYLRRRRENGWGMYAVLGIHKQDKEKMHLQQLRNFKFFDAPVGLFFTAHKELEAGAKMAIAMLMQNIMLIAKARGLDTCPQAAWNDYHSIVMPLLGADENEQFICGMSLGYADLSSEINHYRTTREDLDQFLTIQT